MKEKISIIVPIYNASKTIERCIESLIGQTFKNIEIILVNDGSTDDSLNKCKYYASKDTRIRIINKENGGVSQARNEGIKAATGEFIMFVDSDDWVCRDYCAAMRETFLSGFLVMCDYRESCSNSEENETILDNGEIEMLDKSEFLLFREKGIGSPWNKIFESKVISENKLFFPETISLGEDLAFVVEYLKKIPGNILYLHKKLYVYQKEIVNSLSKQAPTIRQNEMFFEVLTSAVKELSNNSYMMVKLRNQIVMQDFEKNLIFLAKDNHCAFIQKCKKARTAVNTKAFRMCCSEGVGSNNPLYQWMYRKRLAEILMLYLVIAIR